MAADGPLPSDTAPNPGGPLRTGDADGVAGADGVGVGRCPTTLDLMSQPAAVLAGQVIDDTVKLPLTRVTLCRYRHPTFDWSLGNGTRRAGPRDGTPGQFGTPLRQYLDQRIWRPPSLSPTADGTPLRTTPGPTTSPPTSGCAYPSPQSDITLDVVYTVDAAGVAREYRLDRITCAPGSSPDPARQLEAAVDRILGPPY
jgi:hypothetical protein